MKDKKSIADVLGQIAEAYGEDIFLEQRRMYAILSDLAPGDFYAKQRRRIKMALEAGSVEILLKAKRDENGAELYINESVKRLINNTDMAEDIAKETIALIAEALSVNPAEASNERPKELKSKEKRQRTERQSKWKELTKAGKYAVIGILSLCGAAAALSLAVLFVNLDTIGKQWFIGIVSGAALTAGVVGLAFLIENKIYNEKCQTITISLPILLAANIVLRAVLGNEAYGLIFYIISAWIVAGAAANIVLTRVESEEKWTWPNAVVLVLAVLFVSLNTAGKQWFIGIVSGVVLTAGVVGLAFLIENKIYNEKCQTITISLPILLAANIVLRAVLGNETYGLIFHIISAWIVAGAAANIVLTRVESEEKWIWPNAAVALCSGFLFFLWPGDFSWTVWQWIIGIGGSLALSALAVIVSWILEEIGAEIYQSLSVMLILTTTANFVLLFTLKQDYLIIAMCFMAAFTVGAIITAFMSFGEDAPVPGFINIVIAIINCGIFIVLVTGSYRLLEDYVQLLPDKMKAKPTQS